MIFLGSRNLHKLEEMRALLPDLDLQPLPDSLPEAPETGDTFSENARQKSEFYAKQTGQKVLADDSGLCVVALDGAPGVLSARYAGDGADDMLNNALLLSQMKDEENRQAYFACVLSLSSPDGEILQVEGRCEGSLLSKPEGESGFGYDPLFHSNDLNKSFGLATEAEKNSCSHRSAACKKFLEAYSQLATDS